MWKHNNYNQNNNNNNSKQQQQKNKMPSYAYFATNQASVLCFCDGTMVFLLNEHKHQHAKQMLKGINSFGIIIMQHN